MSKLLTFNNMTLIPQLNENKVSKRFKDNKMSDSFLPVLTLPLLKNQTTINLIHKPRVEEQKYRNPNRKKLRKSLVVTRQMFILSSKVIFLQTN